MAEQEKLSLKDALRQAAVEFTERQGKHDPSDPLFAGSVPETNDDVSLSATETDEYRYE